MYHYHNEYAALGIGAIAYYKGLSPRDKSFIDEMTSAIVKAAQPSVRRMWSCPNCATLFDDEEMYKNHACAERPHR